MVYRATKMYPSSGSGHFSYRSRFKYCYICSKFIRMAGITGFIDLSNKSSEDIIVKMAKSLEHRGPRQAIVFQQQDDCQVGLGQQSANSEIAFYNDHFILYDGLIYNFKEIKQELLTLGHTFTSHTEEEVILHAWLEWGEKSIDKWHGVFSIVIYNKNKNDIFVIRDRPGVKPFYYSWQNDIFIFGSELKALMAHPHFEKNIDRDVLASYLQYGYISAPYSIFKNTFKLRGGFILYFNAEKRSTEQEQYWNVYDYYNKPKLKISLPEAIEETESILMDAFKLRMLADKPVGLFLSGGFDSCCAMALLQKESTEKLKTFTIGTTSNQYDEAPYAKKIAEHLGTDHTEYYCTAQESLDIIPQLPYFYDEPYADSSAIPTTLVCKMAKQKVGAALSSDAGDEVFAGYNRYDYISRYGNKIKAIPAPLRKLAAGIMDFIPSEKIPVLKNMQNIHSRYDKMKNLLRDPSPEELLKNLSLVFTNKEIEKIFGTNPPVTFLKTLHTSSELQPEFYDALAYMQAIDYQSYLTDDGCVKVDRAANSVSFEVRDPFFDHKIIEWAAQLPSDYKYHNGIKKYITREIVYKHIPRELMERPKMGFGIPVQDWLANELKPVVEEHLNTQALSHGYFNTDEITRLKNDFYAGQKDKYLKLWYVLMFQMWYKEWMK